MLTKTIFKKKILFFYIGFLFFFFYLRRSVFHTHIPIADAVYHFVVVCEGLAYVAYVPGKLDIRQTML